MLLLAGFCAVVSGAFSFFWRWLMDARRDGRLSALEDDVDRLDMTLRSAKGVQARQDKAERMEMMMAEAIQMQKDGKQPKEILAALVPKYPDVAVSLGKKLFKGSLPF